jgi:hypothetical protein
VNRALAARGADAVLVPLHVGSDGLAPLVRALRTVRNLAGVFSMPHENAIVDLLDAVTPEARQVGACNVVRREPDGRLVGTISTGKGSSPASAPPGTRSAGGACSSPAPGALGDPRRMVVATVALRERSPRAIRAPAMSGTPGPVAAVHRIFIVTALLCALVYAGWEALELAQTGELLAGARALVALAVAVGIGVYLRSLRDLAARLTPRD